jgi:hypothetical protein
VGGKRSGPVGLGASTKNGLGDAANGQPSSIRAKPNCSFAVAEGSCLRTLVAGSHFCLEHQEARPPDLRRGVVSLASATNFCCALALQHIKQDLVQDQKKSLRKRIRQKGKKMHTVADSTIVPAISTARVGVRDPVVLVPCSQRVACRCIGGRSSGAST